MKLKKKKKKKNLRGTRPSTRISSNETSTLDNYGTKAGDAPLFPSRVLPAQQEAIFVYITEGVVYVKALRVTL